MRKDKSAKQENIATIYLNGEITEENKYEFLSAIDQIFLDGEKIERLRIIIDSPGGSIQGAFAMADRLERLKSQGVKLEALVEGVAASSATIVLLVCDKRGITPNSRIWIHLPIRPPIDEEIDEIRLQEIVTGLKKIKMRIAKLTAERTGQKLKRVLIDMKKVTDFTAEEAVAYGFAHKII